MFFVYDHIQTDLEYGCEARSDNSIANFSSLLLSLLEKYRQHPTKMAPGNK
jgi:hypothetical protein